LVLFLSSFADSKNVEVSLANVFPLEAEKEGHGKQKQEEMEVSLEETTDTAQGINDSKKTLVRRYTCPTCIAMILVSFYIFTFSVFCT